MDVKAVMFAATAVAVTAKLVVNATEPEVIVTPLTVMLSTDPAPPPVILVVLPVSVVYVAATKNPFVPAPLVTAVIVTVVPTATAV